MNREEIEALSGEELAAAVAVQVMGWTLSNRGWVSALFWNDRDGKMLMVDNEWRPDRDVAQAFEVMRAKDGWRWYIEESLVDTFVEAFLCFNPAQKSIHAWEEVGSDGNWTRAWCVAICRASLLAADTDLGRIKSIDDAKNAERKKSFAAIAYIRAMYPEDIFPPDSDSRDAISGTWARKVCDNIRREMEIGTEEE